MSRRRATRPRRMAPLLVLGEQAAFALTNLASQLLLARAVTPDAFGAYTVASTFLFMAAIVHQTCLIEPMVVFSAGRLRRALPSYHGLLLGRWSMAFGIACGAVALMLAVLATALGTGQIGAALAAFAAVAPFVLHLWLLRRMAFSLGRPDLSFTATLIYAGATLSAIGAMLAFGALGVTGAILASGFAAAAGSVFLTARLRWPARTDSAPRDLVARHLRYGRWALGAEAVNWAQTSGPILILPLWLGLAASAELRMLALVFMPLLQVASVASLILLRHLAGNARPDPAAIITTFLTLAGGAAAYTLAVVAGWTGIGPKLLGAGYAIDPVLIAIGGCGATCLVAAQAFIVTLRARERTGAVLAANLAALLMLAALMPAALPHGVRGVVTAQAIAWAVALVVSGLLAAARPRLGEWLPFPPDANDPKAEIAS